MSQDLKKFLTCYDLLIFYKRLMAPLAVQTTVPMRTRAHFLRRSSQRTTGHILSFPHQGVKVGRVSSTKMRQSLMLPLTV